MDVTSIARASIGLNQTRVQFEAAARLLKIANEAGAEAASALIEQVARASEQMLQQTAATSGAGVDFYG